MGLFENIWDNINTDEKRVHFAPNIPQDKLKKAITKYGFGIHPDEVVILVDDTVFGSAEDGFIITEDAIYAHEMMENPMKMNFTDIRSIEYKGAKLIINGSTFCAPSQPSNKILHKIYDLLKQYILNLTQINKPNEHYDTLAPRFRPYINIDRSIFISENIPQKKLQSAINKYAQNIEHDSVIVLIDDTIFGSSDTGMLLTEDAIYIHEMMTDPIKIKFADIDDISIHGKSLIINGNKVYTSIQPSKKSIEKIYSILINYLPVYKQDLAKTNTTVEQEGDAALVITSSHQENRFNEAVKSNEDIHVQRKCGINLEKASKPYKKADRVDIELKVDSDTSINEKKYANSESVDAPFAMENMDSSIGDNNDSVDVNTIKGDTTESSFDKSGLTNIFVKPIAKLNGYALVVVVLLRDNAPEKLMDVLSKLPIVGIVGFVGRMALKSPLKWLSEQIRSRGEVYVMEQLVGQWKKEGISDSELRSKIDGVPDVIFGKEQKNACYMLLDIYYLGREPDEVRGYYTLASTVELVACKACGTHNPKNAKFCQECGNKLTK